MGRSLGAPWALLGRSLAIHWVLVRHLIGALSPSMGCSLAALVMLIGRSLGAPWPSMGCSLAIRWPSMGCSPVYPSVACWASPKRMMRVLPLNRFCPPMCALVYLFIPTSGDVGVSIRGYAICCT